MNNTETQTNMTEPLPRIDTEAIEQRARERDANGFWDEPTE